MNFEFSRQNVVNTLISNLMKIRPVGTKLFLVDGRWDERINGQTWWS